MIVTVSIEFSIPDEQGWIGRKVIKEINLNVNTEKQPISPGINNYNASLHLEVMKALDEVLEFLKEQE